MKRFNVVIPKEDGGVELYPMKEWLRQHPDQVPSGLDATTSTSHELRNGLKKMGWSAQTTDNEVRLVMAGAANIETNVDAILGGEDAEDDASQEAAFGLEYQLRDFIAQNLAGIPVDGKKLRLFVDPTGRDGIEFPTAVGPIDILAIDDAGAFVVFELKRGRSPDHAIGQLSRYMGWVKQTIGKDKNVRGVIVAKTISDSLRYSVAVVPDVSLFEYEVSFQLKSVQAFGTRNSGFETE
jgi:Endonuclease NucS C-terminal domain